MVPAFVNASYGVDKDGSATCGAGIEYLVPRVLVDFTRAGAPRSESTRVCPASFTTWTGLGARCLGWELGVWGLG